MNYGIAPLDNPKRTGEPEEPQYPHCPICGEECDTIYRDKNGEFVGCNECIEVSGAWQAEECFPEVTI